MIAARTHGATTKETVVNGNDVKLWRFSNGVEHNHEVRQVAAALPRDMDGLKKVDGSANYTANVWLEACPNGAEIREFEAPDGYQIANVSWFESGVVCVGLEVDA